MERLSIELTDRCDKACAFCYARGSPAGVRAWRPEDVIALLRDCAARSVRAVSFGGGEPLQYPPLGEVLEATRGLLFRSLTTNGLLLESALPALARWRPEKVHVSVHDPADRAEVARAARQVDALEASGIRGGVNVLVRRSALPAARAAVRAFAAAGIHHDRLILLPMRHGDTPTAEELAAVAGAPFQSATCLAGCAPSARFASLDADGRVGRCSYTRRRRRLAGFTWEALRAALDGLGVEPCGGTG